MFIEKKKKQHTGKKILLILDDLWNEDRKKWEVVHTPLNYGIERNGK